MPKYTNATDPSARTLFTNEQNVPYIVEVNSTDINLCNDDDDNESRNRKLESYEFDYLDYEPCYDLLSYN
jgi:hypothetical protein